MTDSARYTIIIVGGGPAGLATALHIARRNPALADELLILEAAEYPRRKVCGGGVTFHGEAQLRQLDLQIDVPAVRVNRIPFRLGQRAFSATAQDAMRIILREEFDAGLAAAVRRHGLTLHTSERLLDLHPAAGGVTVTTTVARYRAQVVIGADEANSRVRQALGLRGSTSIARLLRVMTPVDMSDPLAECAHAAFDFSCLAQGIQGYVWDFPCLIDGQPYMNRGIFDSRIVPAAQSANRTNLKASFAETLRDRHIDLAAVRLEGYPVRWFQPAATFSRPHVLLAGDAAGVDPLFAEGISYSMQYGVVVAETIQAAFVSGDFTFADYRTRLLRHPLGRSLQRRAVVARQLYGYRHPRLWSWLWQAAALAPRAVNRAVGAALDVLPPVHHRSGEGA